MFGGTPTSPSFPVGGAPSSRKSLKLKRPATSAAPQVDAGAACGAVLTEERPFEGQGAELRGDSPCGRISPINRNLEREFSVVSPIRPASAASVASTPVIVLSGSSSDEKEEEELVHDDDSDFEPDQPAKAPEVSAAVLFSSEESSEESVVDWDESSDSKAPSASHRRYSFSDDDFDVEEDGDVIAEAGGESDEGAT